MSFSVDTLDKSPVLEHFNIRGLHGSKDLKFSAADSVSILMARNGSGKTTLLAAMNAVLTGAFYRLSDFSFEAISVKLQGINEFTISKSDIESLKNQIAESHLSKIASECGVSTDYVIDVGLAVIKSGSKRYDEHPGIKELNSRHPTLGHISLHDAVTNYVSNMYNSVPNLDLASKQVAQVMADYDIVYLPTYRRIEMSLARYQVESGPRYSWGSDSRSAASLLPSEMKFGLSDIAERLLGIYQEIQRKSNTTYQKISANIINDLLDGSYDQLRNLSGKPEKNELELFFSRIRSSRNRMSGVTIPDIDKIYRDDIDERVRPFLLYFLSNLNEAILSTKPLEDRVNGFIEACNKYLSDDDETAFRYPPIQISSSDSKKINISRDTFRPFFTTRRGEKKISIDSLSSGEKQVVSLFARLYLYQKKKIILYDEPELSLSIGWQTQLLPDVCRSPDFQQIITITHSPFIFDNELDSYASNLIVSPYISDQLEFDPAVDILADLDEILDEDLIFKNSDNNGA